MLKASVLLSTLAVLTIGSTAHAGHAPGLVLGGSIDGGHMGCEDKNGNNCGDGVQPAGGFSLHIGGMVDRNVALLGELWGMGHTEDNVTASQTLATFAVRGWVVPRLWLQGGLGLARSTVEVDYGNVVMSDQTDTVPAFMAGLGVELVHTRTFGLDLELRSGSGFYRGDARVYNAAIGVGASWY